MIAPGNHWILDSLRGAPPPGEAMGAAASEVLSSGPHGPPNALPPGEGIGGGSLRIESKITGKSFLFRIVNKNFIKTSGFPLRFAKGCGMIELS